MTKMYQLNKLPLCTQIIKKYYNDGPRLVLASKCYKWQNREVNSIASFPRKYFNYALITPRNQDKKVGFYLAAQCLYWQGRSTSTCNDFKTEHSKTKKKKGVLYYTLGFLLVGSAATIAYAESDPEFREWLEIKVPGTNEFIKVIYQEEKPYGESFDEYKNKLKAALIAKIQEMVKKDQTTNLSSKEEGVPVIEEVVIEQCVYKPPVPAFTELQKHAGKEEHYTERRIISEKSEIIPLEDTGRKMSDGAAAYANLPETHPLNLIDLEKRIGDSAEKAICTYVTAIQAIREYSKELYQLIDQAFKKPDSEVWGKLREKAIEKQHLIDDAEKEVKVAMNNIERLRVHLDNPDVEASYVIRERARKNVERILQDIDDAKKRFEKEADALSVAQKFWKKVEDTRKFFNDDLTILFPKIRTRDKHLKMSDEEIALLLSHLYQSILYYQKEFSKVDNVRTSKFKQTVEELQTGKKNVVDAMIEAEMENELRKLQLNNEKKELAVMSDFEKMSHIQLKRQAEAQREYLKDLLAWKEVEVERSMLSGLDDKLDEIRSSFKLEVAGMTGRMKGFNVDEKTSTKDSKNQQQAQVLWSACQTLLTALNSATNNRPWTQQLHPLQAEISAIVKAADGKDELVNVVVASIPKKAINRGVYSKEALKERFIKVKQLATRLAQVTDGGAPAFLLFLSLIQSFFIFKSSDPIPIEEVTNEPIDPTEFTTYDILQRAKYWLERDDLELSIRYMNLLQGAPKSIAKDWIEEAITFLETQQAADTLLAHASSAL